MRALLLLLIGAAALVAALSLARRMRAVRAWPTVEAAVTPDPIGPVPAGVRVRVEPTVTLRYAVAGVGYTVPGRRLVTPRMAPAAAQAWLDAQAARQVVHYNPHAPGEAYIDRGSWPLVALATACGATFTALGLIDALGA